MKRRTPTVKTTETSAKTVGATTDETVHYVSGAVQMRPNVAYEEVEYPEEDIYEHPK